MSVYCNECVLYDQYEQNELKSGNLNRASEREREERSRLLEEEISIREEKSLGERNLSP